MEQNGPTTRGALRETLRQVQLFSVENSLCGKLLKPEVFQAEKLPLLYHHLPGHRVPADDRNDFVDKPHLE